VVKESRLSIRALRWEGDWSQPDYAPTWLPKGIPPEIQRAAQEWFVPGSRLLDIGCGDGAISAWLAGRGFEVTGVDLAPSAIKLAKETHHAPNLHFDVADVTRSLPQRGFDGLLDRGCLHLIPRKAKPAYVTNVAAAANRGARFLLLNPRHPDRSAEDVIAEVRNLCGVWFRIERIVEVVMARFDGGEHPGVVFWMFRR